MSSITLSSPLCSVASCLKLRLPSNLKSIRDKQEAQDLIAWTQASVYWNKRRIFRYGDYRRKVALGKRLLKLLKKVERSVPSRLDMFGNTISTYSLPTWESGVAFAKAHGISSLYPIEESLFYAVNDSCNLAMLYVEGDVTIYDGPKANNAVNRMISLLTA